jgi:general secretion pathway protein K
LTTPSGPPRAAVAPDTAPDTANDSGFILIPVLVTLGLLSVIAMALAKTTIIDVRTAAYQLREAEAEALADGASRLAIRRVIADRTAGRSGSNTGGRNEAALGVDGRQVACRLPGATAVITVQDTGGLVDLNTAPQVLFERLFVSIDVPKDDAAKLAAAIIDFRDLDDSPVPGGAEAAEYRAAGLPFGPKNAPFTSVSELDQVLGMTPAVLSRIRPLVTVFSSSRGIDLNVASQQLRGLGLPNEFVVPSNGRAFLVRVTATTDLRTSFTRELVFEPNLRAPLGFVITDWRRGANVETSAAVELPSCLDLARSE